ncbi:MAG: hypothetical protein CFE39_03820 [Comamonadaceae bacterium PBBC2]|nr:MAG: hypothetical protein CFE39_03820 [Comamonadaceae bacterium PBBC2]
MCKGCDSNLGGTVEKNIPRLIIPKSMNAESWDKLPIYNSLVGTFDGEEVSFPAYDYGEPEATEVDRFVVLVAWRALHAEAISPKDSTMLVAFMESPSWIRLDQSARKFIAGGALRDCGGVARPDLWRLDPEMVAGISKDSEELPISWGVIGESKVEAVMVLFGFWLVFWRVNFDEPLSDKTRIVLAWLGFLRKHYAKMNA